MKRILGLIKKNLIIVVSVVIALASFPTLYILSSGWEKKVRTEVEQKVSSDLRELNQINVNYQAPSLDPTAPAVEFSGVPNEPTSLAIQKYLASLAQESKRLNELALRWNNPDRQPLVDGLFPEPSEAQRQTKLQEMARIWPDEVRDLLRQAGAGMPPDPEQVFEQLQARLTAERLRLLGVSAGEDAVLSPEASKEIQAALGAERLEIYRSRADQLHFYASDDALAGVVRWDETRGAPPLELEWEWQHEYWVFQDTIHALTVANTDQAGQLASLIDGPIKRVERVAVQPWDLESISTATTPPPPTVSLTGQIPQDYEVSPTGRTAWPTGQNPLYDIRYVDLVLVVDSSRIAQVVDAFPRAGLMTVVSMSIESYDPQPDLQEGFFYGPGNLVRLRMRVETLWMRQWMAPMMPATVRAALGVPDEWASPKSDTDSDVVNEENAPGVG
jgi:hypothetical protein